VKVLCVGGGPAGLYFSLLMKLRTPRHDVTILERSDTPTSGGWGVTLGQDVLDLLLSHDPASAEAVRRAACYRTHQVVRIGRSHEAWGGDGIYNIGRQSLVDILADRARELGVGFEYGREVAGLTGLPTADLIVAADGVQSRLRSVVNGFGTHIRSGGNKYIWLGSSAPFEEFNYLFAPTDHGWLWAYAYQFDPRTSTFIVECAPSTWSGLGLDGMSPDDGAALLGDLFKDYLGGHPVTALLPDGRTARWLDFETVSNERWHVGNVALVGDSAHTSHFSVGQGTKMALDDGIVLVDSLHRNADLEAALTAYERERKAQLVRPLRGAHLSAEWFENLPRYIALKPHEFATLLAARWSPLVPILPPRLSYQLRRARGRDPVTLGRALNPAPDPAGDAAVPEELVRGTVQARVLADGAPSSPR
jgi:2-polyprenyl-6-methoxyphenol hydroxylase-like FAD-dependent oxidoreductase